MLWKRLLYVYLKLGHDIVFSCIHHYPFSTCSPSISNNSLFIPKYSNSALDLTASKVLRTSIPCVLNVSPEIDGRNEFKIYWQNFKNKQKSQIHRERREKEMQKMLPARLIGSYNSNHFALDLKWTPQYMLILRKGFYTCSTSIPLNNRPIL